MGQFCMHLWLLVCCYVCQTSGWTRDKCYFIVILLFVTLDLVEKVLFYFIFYVLWKIFFGVHAVATSASTASFRCFCRLCIKMLLGHCECGFCCLMLFDVFSCLVRFLCYPATFFSTPSLFFSHCQSFLCIWIKDTRAAVCDIKAYEIPLEFWG